MLPASCPYVQDVQRQREQTVQKTRKHSEFDLTEEPKAKRPRWLQKHWQKMQELEVDPKNLHKVDAASRTFSSQRAVHAVEVYESGGHKGTLSVSQQINRMTVKGQNVPCITPGAQLWNMEKKRLLTGLEKMLFQGYPVHRLKLRQMKEKELHSLGGNGMNIRSVAAAFAVAFSVLDVSAFYKAAMDKAKQ
ncbi:unnamed protein product [Durusdinium trenchii]